jgi:hypothetical protein
MGCYMRLGYCGLRRCSYDGKELLDALGWSQSFNIRVGFLHNLSAPPNHFVLGRRVSEKSLTLSASQPVRNNAIIVYYYLVLPEKDSRDPVSISTVVPALIPTRIQLLPYLRFHVCVIYHRRQASTPQSFSQPQLFLSIPSQPTPISNPPSLANLPTLPSRHPSHY